MFGFFKPKCPVDLQKKAWVEDAVLKLIDLFGESQLRRFEVITPGSRKLPQNFDGSDESVLNLCHWVCEQMSVAAGRIQFHIVGQHPGDQLAGDFGGSTSGFNGLYYSPREDEPAPQIYILDTLRSEPQRLLATIAHEVAHDVTYQRWPSLYEDRDLEYLTDLMPLFFGFGIFMANSVVQQRNYSTAMGYVWEISGSGYLGVDTYGYALAVLSYLRHEQHLEWDEHLKDDPQGTFRKGLKYLRSTRDRLVDQQSVSIRRSIKTPRDIHDELETGLPTRQLKALWELQEHPEWVNEFIEETFPFVRSSEDALVIAALYVLRHAKTLNRQQYVEILDGAFSPILTVRIAVARLIEPGSPDPELGFSVLTRMLSDAEGSVQTAALQSLSGFDGVLSAALEPACLRCLQISRSTHDMALQQEALTLLKKIVVDVEQSLRVRGQFDVNDIRQMLRPPRDDRANKVPE